MTSKVIAKSPTRFRCPELRLCAILARKIILECIVRHAEGSAYSIFVSGVDNLNKPEANALETDCSEGVKSLNALQASQLPLQFT